MILGINTNIKNNHQYKKNELFVLSYVKFSRVSHWNLLIYYIINTKYQAKI